MAAVELTGMVIRKHLGSISRSAHEGVCIDTASGQYELRRRGANPFTNPEFQKWVGQEVRVVGVVRENILFVENIRLVTSDQ